MNARLRLPVLGSSALPPGNTGGQAVVLGQEPLVRAAVVAPRTVRLSLTDRCDLACVYCRPASKESFLDDSLADAAFETMVDGLFAAGVRRFRITGGEPLLHRNVVERVRSIASRKPDDLALTTNATRLAPLAAPLFTAGLTRITVSLDSLSPETFARMTRGGKLSRVLEGIAAARDVGFAERKLNVVVVRDHNDHELCDLAEFAWSMGMTPRFIEVMPVGEGASLGARAVVSAAEMRERLAPLVYAERGDTDPDRGPARYVHARRDPSLRIGFITGTTDTFCEGCDRLRVGSDGFVRACLARDEGLPASAAAKAGDASEVAQTIARAWEQKPDGAVWKGCTEESAREVSMREIGG